MPPRRSKAKASRKGGSGETNTSADQESDSPGLVDLPAGVMTNLATRLDKKSLSHLLSTHRDIKNTYSRSTDVASNREYLFRQKLKKEFHFEPTYENMYRVFNNFTNHPKIVGELSSVQQKECLDISNYIDQTLEMA